MLRPSEMLGYIARHHPPEDVSTTHSESVDHFLEHISKTTRDIVQALSVIPDSNIGFQMFNRHAGWSRGLLFEPNGGIP